MQRQVVPGIGAGPCGLRLFAEVLARQPGARVTCEQPPLLPWVHEPGAPGIGEDVDRNADGVVDHQTRFAYDGEQIVLAFDKEGAGEITAADLSHRYLWRPAVDQLLADERTHADPKADVASDDVLWALTDHLGSVRDQARLEGTTTKVVNHVVFGSFGEVLSESNPAEGSLFGFTGRPESEAAGLRNHWQRWTDPRIGDWMSEDPLGFAAGDTNTRRYVGNSPTNATDPSGLEPPVPNNSFPPGWDPSKHACWNCHAPVVQRWWSATPAERLRWLAEPQGVPWNFTGSAWELWEAWWNERNYSVVRDITISGDTPFTLELRQIPFFDGIRTKAVENIRTLELCTRPGAEREAAVNGRDPRFWDLIGGDCTRSYGFLDIWRGPVDIFNMFIGYQYLYSGNVADTLVGSFKGRYSLSNFDWDNRTATITFTIDNKTGWNSATSTKIRDGCLLGSENGPFYRQTISWTETLHF